MTVARALLQRVAGASIVLLATLLIGGQAFGMLRPPAQQPRGLAQGAIELTTDAGATALFDAHELTPGHVVTRCVAVSYQGDPVPAHIDLRLQADGALTRYLDMTVESGTGGGHGTCEGFTGTSRFRGSMAEFTATHGDGTAGLVVPMGDPATATTTFRFGFTPQDAPAAQGLATTGAFTWSATAPDVASADPPPDEAAADPGPTGPAPTAPAPAAPAPTTTEPSTTTPSTTTPSTTSPPTIAPPAADTEPTAPQTDGAAEVPDADTAVAPVEPSPDDDAVPALAGASAPGPMTGIPGRRPTAAAGFLDGPGDAVAAVWRVLGDAAEVVGAVLLAAAEASRFPFLLLVLVLMFLAVQDRIDRRDPKLALAPIGAEPELVFEPPSAPRGALR